MNLRTAMAQAILIAALGASLAQSASADVRADVQAGTDAIARKDYTTAWRDLITPARAGDAEAEALIGAMLVNKINPSGTGNYADAQRWLQAAANQGHKQAMNLLAKFYIDDGKLQDQGRVGMGDADRVQARQWYQKSSDLGDGYAMASLAIMMDAGIGGPVDHAAAERYRNQVKGLTDPAFAKKATGDPVGQALTAQWQSGHYQDALKSAYDLAMKGNVVGEATLGRAYYEGLGTPRNYHSALFWLTKAADQKSPDGMFFLGMMYEYGRGVTPDINKAIKLFDDAASHGQRYAEMEAAGMRMQGEAAAQAARTPGGREAQACSMNGGIYGSDGMCMAAGPGGDYIDPYTGNR